MHHIIETKKNRLARGKLALVFIALALTLFFLLQTIGFLQEGTPVTHPDIRDRLTVSVSKKASVVRGNGKVVSADIQILSANESGFVDQILVKRGQVVNKGDVLLKINNPSLIREYKEAQFTTKDILTEVTFAQSQLELERAKLESELEKSRSTLKKHELELLATKRLGDAGIVSKVKMEQLNLTVEQAISDVKNLEKRVGIFEKHVIAQNTALIAKKHAALERLAFFETRIESLNVKAPMSGLVKELNLTQGESLNEGSKLIEVVQQSKLFAEITIPQYHAHSVNVGFQATIKTPSGQLVGSVEFVDPIVRQRSVMVRVALPDVIPDWISLEQTVEAEISTSLETEVVSVNRPENYIESESWVIFRVVNNEMIRTDISILSGNQDTLFLGPGLSDGEEIVMVQANSHLFSVD